jgi:phosphoribosylaminoimidazole (AIR) synthetase
MGIGFCLVVSEPDAERVLHIAAEHGTRAWRIGITMASPERTITIEPRHLQSHEQRFVAV